MPRRPRASTGGYVYHVLNRGVGRATLFESVGDYEAFVNVLTQAVERSALRLLGWCVMPNHWHLVLWPRRDGELSEWLRWLTVTHTQRWHAAHHTSGTGPLYQGRFKSFPIQADEHYRAVLRYVERNPLRANLVSRAQDWLWSSLPGRGQADSVPKLAAGPEPLPMNWVSLVNRAETTAELAALRRSTRRGTPFGSPRWQARTALRLGLQATLRPRGRPKKVAEGEK